MFGSVNDMFTMFFITFWPSDSQLLAASSSLNARWEKERTPKKKKSRFIYLFIA